MQDIDDCLSNVLRAENAYLMDETSKLQKKHNELKTKKNRLLDLLISNSISQGDYTDKKNEIEEELYAIDIQLNAHSQADNAFTTTVESIFALASHAGELFKSSKVEQKRALLNLLLSNCELKDKKLVYSIRKPFDVLLNMNGCQSWLGQLDSNQH